MPDSADSTDGPSTALGGVLRVAPGVVIRLDELDWRFSPAGGPGGQHANTSNTRAEVTFGIAASPSLPSWARARLTSRLGASVSVSAGERRSQAQNRRLALERLGERLASALEVERPRRPTRPTGSSQRRRLEEKRRRGQLKRQRRASGDDPG
ncbi:MAG TPA: alternative ribosome rescue aminoacyl-tRNA hydrolase ArfB [Acidimicrobiales bacterium]|nr:alternative ribosome rescue aminoacyl-tRNA hydrolase ArfB [Acidimicrobiales bacterium]